MSCITKVNAVILIFIICQIGIHVFERMSIDPVMMPSLDFNHADRSSAARLKQLYNGAVQLYEKNKNEESLRRLADLLLCYGYHSEAAQLYKSMLVITEGESLPAWEGLAMSLDSLGYLEESAKCYENAVRMGSTFEKMFKHRGAEIALMNGDEVLAERLLLENDSYLPSLYRLTRLYIVAKRDQEASARYRRFSDYHEVAHAIEQVQLNELAKRWLGHQFEELPIKVDRVPMFTKHPIEVFQKHIEGFYRMSVRDLFTPALFELPMYAVPRDNYVERMELRNEIDNPQYIKSGMELFHGNNCIICHGEDAYGKTAPNLRDDFWLGDGTPDGIFNSIMYGRAQGTMPAHQFSLRPDQIRDIAIYLVDLNKRTPKQDGRTDRGKPPEGDRAPLLHK